MDDLFTRQAQRNAPLADRMRPRNLDEFIGQDHIVGPGRLLRRAIETDSLQSSIFFGPPGCGKTTLAAIVANSTHSAFVKMNAVTAGVKELREVLAEAESQLKLYGRPTYLLLDECHRWSKAQSDALLPALETGVVRFIGSTTENPMIAMTGAIVSRCRLFQFYPLSVEDVKKTHADGLSGPGSGAWGTTMPRWTRKPWTISPASPMGTPGQPSTPSSWRCAPPNRWMGSSTLRWRSPGRASRKR